jgi:hypothetical protein
VVSRYRPPLTVLEERAERARRARLHERALDSAEPAVVGRVEVARGVRARYLLPTARARYHRRQETYHYRPLWANHTLAEEAFALYSKLKTTADAVARATPVEEF